MMKRLFAVVFLICLLSCGGGGDDTPAPTPAPIPIIIPTPTPTPAPIPTESYTKLLLHMDGTNGSTNFTDSSDSAKIVTSIGGANISTAYQKIGIGSGAFSGIFGRDYLTIPDSEDWHFGISDFTIDFWIYFNNTRGDFGICGQGGAVAGEDNYWAFAYSPGNFIFEAWTRRAIALYENTSWVPVLHTWYHIELDRNGVNMYLFINGISQTFIATVPIFTNSLPDITAVLEIGASYNHVWVMDGFLDEFRISKGIARHTSNFTPPTQAYFLTQEEMR